MQRKKGPKWRATGGGLRATVGPLHKRVIDLPRGTYRVRVKAAHDHASSTSKSVRLRR